ncbi:MAG: DUF2339 domain-containing protein [Methyloceanibacter sp.]
MFGSIVALVLAIPVLAVISLVLTAGARTRVSRLEYKVTGLERRLAALEGGAPSPAAVAPSAAQPPTAIDTIPLAAEPPTAAPVEPVAAAAAPKPAAVKPISLEERFGTQWVVWAGGIALALGGFFLVRYSIEQGWFGPGARVLLAAAVALALIAAGEWTRRNEIHTGLKGLSSANIPSLLTAAGTAIAYADVYAAHALYGFLNAGTAFLLLGIVALATLTASLLHGPALAGLGLVGAFVTPLIVSTETPSYWALYLYLGAVTAAAFGMARARRWRWLAVTAVVAGVLWTLPGIDDLQAVTPHAFHVAAGFTLTALLIVSGFIFGPDAERGEIDATSSGALAAYLLASTLLVLTTGHDNLALLLFVALVAATVVIAWRTDASAAAVPPAALLVALVFAHWAFQFDLHELGVIAGDVPDAAWRPERFLFGAPLMLGTAFALLFGAPPGSSRNSAICDLWSQSCGAPQPSSRR